jgi:hypothetical protein
MSISRRDLLVYGTGIGAALPLIGNLPTARADGDGGGDGNSYGTEAARRLAAFATALQCSRLPELPLITGDNSVNGGIRFDDELAVVTSVSKWTLQRAARVGDRGRERECKRAPHGANVSAGGECKRAGARARGGLHRVLRPRLLRFSNGARAHGPLDGRRARALRRRALAAPGARWRRRRARRALGPRWRGRCIRSS